MSHDQAWHDERRKGLGGSDAAAALGLSPWKSPLALYMEKRGEAPPVIETEPMRWGTILEPVIRQEYANRTGHSVTVPLKAVWHANGFMLANLDGVMPEKRRLFEAKSGGLWGTRREWGEPGTDQIPQGYLVQVQHYLYVTGMDVADVAVLLHGSDFRIYEVPGDRELQEMIVEGEHEFWECVKRGEPPEPRDLADVQLRYGRSSVAQSVQATVEIAASCAALHSTRAMIAQLEEGEDKLKAEILTFLAERDTLMQGEKVLATWKLPKAPNKLDGEALKKAHPDIYTQFLKTGEASRRFLLKEQE